jgi:hypothetical protein
MEVADLSVVGGIGLKEQPPGMRKRRARYAGSD